MSDYTYTAATIKALTVAEAKAHLNVTHTEDDSLISDYIDVATKVLEDRCQRCFVEQTRKMEMDGFTDRRYVRGRSIYPPRSPLNTVSSIVYLSATNGTATTLPSSDYIVSAHDKPGRISEAYNATWPDTYGVNNDVTITYLTGCSTTTSSVPANVKHAIRMLVAHWYLNRENVIIGTIQSDLSWTLDALLEAEHVEGYA